ncbi:hypothetical protein [Vibrio sp. 10N.239.312.D08]|uniref:hypothetical protein n=1 Tax=Vibrio sp. 10N.239.312.D08 TaxID=3229978 RepID=UPI00354EBE32
MGHFSDIDTSGIKNGQTITAAELRNLARVPGGNKKPKPNDKGANQKSSNLKSIKPKPKKTKKRKCQNDGVELPWHCLFLKEKSRLEADIELLESDKEYYYQVSIFQYIAEHFPHFERLVHASPNGGGRSAFEAYRLKCAGALKGVPDIQFMVARSGYHGLYIELKKLPSDYGKDPEIALKQVHIDQHLVREALLKEDYLAVVCYGVEEALSVVRAYLNETELPQFILSRWDMWDWKNLAKRN